MEKIKKCLTNRKKCGIMNTELRNKEDKNMTNTEYKELFKAVVAEEFKRNLSTACVHQSLCGKIFEQGMSREECKVWINNKDFDKFFKEIRQKVLDTIQNM